MESLNDVPGEVRKQTVGTHRHFHCQQEIINWERPRGGMAMTRGPKGTPQGGLNHENMMLFARGNG